MQVQRINNYQAYKGNQKNNKTQTQPSFGVRMGERLAFLTDNLGDLLPHIKEESIPIIEKFQREGNEYFAETLPTRIEDINHNILLIGTKEAVEKALHSGSTEQCAVLSEDLGSIVDDYLGRTVDHIAAFVEGKTPERIAELLEARKLEVGNVGK